MTYKVKLAWIRSSISDFEKPETDIFYSVDLTGDTPHIGIMNKTQTSKEIAKYIDGNNGNDKEIAVFSRNDCSLYKRPMSCDEIEEFRAMLGNELKELGREYMIEIIR